MVDARARGLVVQTQIASAPARQGTIAKSLAGLVPGWIQAFGPDHCPEHSRYCNVALAIQSVTARSAHSRLSSLRCASNTASCASADVPAAAMAWQRRDLGAAAERLGVGGRLLDHAVEHLGDRHGAFLGHEGAVHAVALRPPLVLDHDGARDRVDVGVAPGIVVEVPHQRAVERRDRDRILDQRAAVGRAQLQRRDA